MTEGSTRTAESDFSRMNAGIVTAFCKKCNRITKQNYLGLEFNSRKVASRCVECRHTNFQEDEPERRRNRSKKEAKPPLKEVEEEKRQIFGSPAQSPATNDQEGSLEPKPD
jgi:hypothetical protein